MTLAWSILVRKVMAYFPCYWSSHLNCQKFCLLLSFSWSHAIQLLDLPLHWATEYSNMANLCIWSCSSLFHVDQLQNKQKIATKWVIFQILKSTVYQWALLMLKNPIWYVDYEPCLDWASLSLPSPSLLVAVFVWSFKVYELGPGLNFSPKTKWAAPGHCFPGGPICWPCLS